MNNQNTERYKWLIDNFKEVMASDPEKNYYAHFYAKQADREDPYLMANLIQNLSDNFHKIVKDANEKIGNARGEALEGLKREIKSLLTYDLTDHPISEITVEKNRKNFESYIEYIESLLRPVDNKLSRVGNNNGSGFDLRLNNQQLQYVLVQLIKENFVSVKTDLNDFINAFNGKELSCNFRPIEWKNKTILTLFIDLIPLKDDAIKWTITEGISAETKSRNLAKLFSAASGKKKHTKTVQLLTNILDTARRV